MAPIGLRGSEADRGEAEGGDFKLSGGVRVTFWKAGRFRLFPQGFCLCFDIALGLMTMSSRPLSSLNRRQSYFSR